MTTDELRESLLASPKNGYTRIDAGQRAEMESYCKDYRAFMDACNAAYLQGHTWRDKFASPMCATDRELRALPPVHIFAADRDVLRDQGKRFAERLEKAGGRVRYELPRGTTHLFVTVPGQSAAFCRAVEFAAEALSFSRRAPHL